jgi:hypothetical protein
MSLVEAITDNGQTCVYWRPVTMGTGRYGQRTYAEPLQMNCRWTDKQQEYLNAAGSRTISNAKVIADIATAVNVAGEPVEIEGLEIGGVLWQGLLAAVPEPSDPLRNPKAYPIGAAGRIPTFDNEEVLHTAML